MNKQQKAVAIKSILITLIGTASIAALTTYIGQQKAERIDLYFIYQVLALGLAGVTILAMKYIADAELGLLKRGDLKADAAPVKILGVKEDSDWKEVGTSFAVIVSLVTGAFLLIAFKDQLSSVSALSWLAAFVIAVPLSITNAFTEEVITRWAIVQGMTGKWSKYAPWVSALIFGGVHYMGIPGGIVGSVMAGFLAWLLAKSIQDTKGIGWAWFLHFLQDVLIFTITIAIFINL